jgi:Domain of unknown function (DUF4384)
MHEKDDMRSVVFKFALVVTSLLVGGVSVIVVGQKKGSLFWDPPPTTIYRVKKADRRPSHPLPAKETGTFLTLQWRLLERGNHNVQQEADPNQVFHTDDQVKLAITTNQSGHLYVIQRMNNGDGSFVFPDPRVNNGLNEVKKNQEYVVPSFCPSFPDPNDCWWKMIPPAGRENFIVVFSRDEFDKLPSHVAEDHGDYEYPVIKRDLIEDLINASRQKVKQVTGQLTIPGKAPARFATRLQNTNLQDNEELIATIQLKHAD